MMGRIQGVKLETQGRDAVMNGAIPNKTTKTTKKLYNVTFDSKPHFHRF